MRGEAGIIILFCFLFGLMALTMVFMVLDENKEIIDVSLTELIEEPKKYIRERVRVSGYLGDTGEVDFSTVLFPIFISTGKTTIITYIPISDSDYYMAVYLTNHFTKGIICNFDSKPTSSIGDYVTIVGRFETERVKIEGVSRNIYIISDASIEQKEG